jgi:hypothetical protein
MHTYQQLTEILIKHHGLHEGHYALRVEFQFGVGMAGPPQETVPSVIAGLKGIGLSKATKPTEHTVDASVVNPVVGNVRKAATATSSRTIAKAKPGRTKATK